MEEQEKIELERAKMRNYILEKENEILLGTIGMITKEKKELINQVKELNKKPFNRIVGKMGRVIRRK